VASADEVRTSVVDAARAMFRARGYLGTTMKGVAAAAGVAPEVVRRYYDNKETLFAAVLQLRVDPAAAIPRLLAPGLDGMGERLVRFVLDTLGDPRAREDLIGLFQSGAAAGRAAGPIAEFLQESVIDRVVKVLGVPDAPGRDPHKPLLHEGRTPGVDAGGRPRPPAGADCPGLAHPHPTAARRPGEQVMSVPAIEVVDLVVNRGRNTVLPGLNCSVRTGLVTGLLGPSGGGKTTLLRAIVGVQRVASAVSAT
jgi:AcrR family transcriptional regulator